MALLLLNGEHECHPRFQNWPQLHHEGISGSFPDTAVESHVIGDEVFAASRNSSPGIDITDVASVREFFNQAGSFDAIVAALGSAPFVYLKDADTEYFQAGFNNKPHGQINLVMHGLDHLADGGSFTLITGILTQQTVEKSVVASTFNAGLEAFTYAASTDIPRGIRIKTVSPNVVEESLDTYGAFFPCFEPVRAQSVANSLSAPPMA